MRCNQFSPVACEYQLLSSVSHSTRKTAKLSERSKVLTQYNSPILRIKKQQFRYILIISTKHININHLDHLHHLHLNFQNPETLQQSNIIQLSPPIAVKRSLTSLAPKVFHPWFRWWLVRCAARRWWRKSRCSLTHVGSSGCGKIGGTFISSFVSSYVFICFIITLPETNISTWNTGVGRWVSSWKVYVARCIYSFLPVFCSLLKVRNAKLSSWYTSGKTEKQRHTLL